ncbi:RidA family protein [Modestobacter roseus]|uniref:Enamine deaminase RidA (YjgF/YER057c/UK114 family) n=1 Tax=Modestobacter roseus TaxID=1181884 RepID=A0A562IVR3_9ACTN|nr:RidA family protein [Modestobacter roseus]MQA34716.1 RidA family protein [Modestobacter roseus]TWH75121.1 enamine deaminase RidA (YjgF/YER057c/UK114 family) [Modestobacter roseus]
MAITLTNPAGLPAPDVYHQVSVATGSRQVFVAGQVAVDATGEKVGVGDFAAQVAQAYRNAGTALAAAGATFADVATMTVFVVDWTLDKMPAFLEGVARASADLGVTPAAPASLIGVSVLFDPDFLVEVQVTAVLD